MFNKDCPAVILGLSETGLGVGRSLGRHGIKVYGISYHKEIGYYSKYIDGILLPHPIIQEADFIESLREFCQKIPIKPVLFITGDEYLTFYTKNNSFIAHYFQTNLPEAKLVETISDKYSQYELAIKSGIDVPRTFLVTNVRDINEIKDKMVYPVFVKAQDVNAWRKVFTGKNKGFVINDGKELIEKLTILIEKEIQLIIQELIVSPDDHNYKLCVYISAKGEYKLAFTLRKIHQYPIHYGIGSSIESYNYPLLKDIGQKLFSAIGYKGVGSAEFKYDEKDGKLKLIEINPRYWQQNSLASFCGMNFPLMDYQEATGQFPDKIESFRENVKWVNISLDIDSYFNYKKEGTMTFGKWLKDLKGEKIISNLSWDDTKPFLKLLISNPVGRLKYFMRRLTFGRQNAKENSNSIK